MDSEVCPKDGLDERYYESLNLQLIRNPGPRFRIEYSQNCGNDMETINNCDVNTDQARCDDGTFPYFETLYYGPNAGQIFIQRLRCPSDPELSIPDGELRQEIVITPSQFRSFPIESSAVNSDPEQFSLRNGHSHLWAESHTQTFSTTINGTSVAIRAIPIQWSWDYGDGTKRNFDQPGEPSPDHTLHHETPTSHSYTETGIFEVNLTTLYRGEFRVVGEGWQPIPGQAAVASDPIPIDVWRTEKELVAPDGQ